MSNVEVPLQIAAILGGVTISEILDVGGPGETADDIDVTNFDDNDNVRKFKRGLIDGGEISIQPHFFYENYVNARGLLHTASATPYTNTVRITNGEVWENIVFSGYVKSVSPSFTKGDKAMFDVAIKVSGKAETSTTTVTTT